MMPANAAAEVFIKQVYRFEPAITFRWKGDIEDFWREVVRMEPRCIFYISGITLRRMVEKCTARMEYRNQDIPWQWVYRLYSPQDLERILGRETTGWSEKFGVIVMQDIVNVSEITSAFLEQNSFPQLGGLVCREISNRWGVSASRIELTYRTDRQVLLNLRKQAEEAAKKLCRQIFLPGMPPAAKCLAAHQYLAATVRYQCPTSEDPVEHYRRHSACGALLDKEAVCQGYAEAFQMLMRWAMIDCLTVNGSAKREEHRNHAWNLVRISGEKFYHVDVTWDRKNEKPDLTYFMRNDAFMADRDWNRKLYPASTGESMYLKSAAVWLKSHAVELIGRGFPPEAVPDPNDPRFQ